MYCMERWFNILASNGGYKKSYPVHLAEYAIKHNLHQLPAFVCWVKHTLQHQEWSIKATKHCFLKNTHKFRIKIPETEDEALQIDCETRTTFWKSTIHKEMQNNRLAFKFLEGNENVPIGYKWIKCCMVFDIKMDFTPKAQYVAVGHMADPPTTITYSSMVSWASVRIILMIADLNDFDALSCDIVKAYLNASPREKVYTTAGLDFCQLMGKRVFIVHALFGF